MSLASGSDAALWFTRDFSGTLDRLVPGQSATPVYQARGHLEVGGVSVSGGRTCFTLSGNQEALGRLMSVAGVGRAKVVADVGAYEAADNSDGHQVYGFRHLPASCTSRCRDSATPT